MSNVVSIEQPGVETVAGEAYVRAMSASSSDRSAREAFHGLVQRIAAPGAAVFDFGCGPGIDAKFYAERGYVVGAYDVDPKMREYFAGYCREFIAAGRVSSVSGTYAEFLADSRLSVSGNLSSKESLGAEASVTRHVDLITSNFAPLNLVPDVREVFAKFYAMTSPTGQVLASVLNPYFVGDLKYGWWWRNVGRLLRQGAFAVQGGQGPITRRTVANFASHASPYFTLERVFPASPAAGRRYSRLALSGSRFMVLLFRRN